MHAALDRDAVADDDVVLDQAVRADIAVVADLCARQHDDELPDPRGCADGGGLDVCQGMDKGLGQFTVTLLLIADHAHFTLA